MNKIFPVSDTTKKFFRWLDRMYKQQEIKDLEALKCSLEKFLADKKKETENE